MTHSLWQNGSVTATMTLSTPEATYEAAMTGAIQEVFEIVKRRHRRYGHNLLRHGLPGILVRIDDKTERLNNMLKQGEDDAEEPRLQTWQDIAGYALQAILIERGQFTLPMELDVLTLKSEHIDMTPSSPASRRSS